MKFLAKPERTWTGDEMIFSGTALDVLQLFDFGMQDCRRCELGNLPANNRPYWRLHGWGLDAKYVLVAQNPAIRRVHLHHPLTKLWDKPLEDRTDPAWKNDGPLVTALSRIGIKREDVYLTNAVKCCYYTVGEREESRNRNPKASHIRACHEAILLRELQLLPQRFNHIICIGRIAGESFGLRIGCEGNFVILDREVKVRVINHTRAPWRSEDGRFPLYAYQPEILPKYVEQVKWACGLTDDYPEFA